MPPAKPTSGPSEERPPPAASASPLPPATALRLRSWKIVAIYAAFASLWIFTSDAALQRLVPDAARFASLSIAKGLAFVTVTSLLLLVLMRRTFGQIEGGYRIIIRHEEELGRSKRLYAALSQINQAIVWSRNREELFQKVCRALVEHGGFRMSWIAWHDPSSEQLVPVAQCGDQGGYLRGIRVYADERLEGRGPSGIAFRQGKPCTCQDILSNPETTPWKQEAASQGLRSSAAIPIHNKGRVRGILNVYATESDFFHEREMALLTEAAADLSFALDNLDLDQERRTAEAAVQTEKNFSETLLESLPGILYFYDQSGKFLRWNKNFETVSGHDSGGIARMKPLDFFSPADRPLLEQRIAEVFEKGESSVEAGFLAKNGTSTPYYFTGNRLLYHGQTCLIGVGIDISQRKIAENALRESEERFRNTLDHILEGCQLLDRDWRYIYLNSAAATQNRCTADRLIGRKITEVYPGIESTRVFHLLRLTMEQRLPAHEEVEFHFPGGSSGWFDITTLPAPEGLFILSIDITERRKAERDLRQLNETLETKVAERTAELNAALERAESADRLKSAFLATMSHELRTPLNSIIGFTGIVLQKMAGPLTDEQSRQLGMVRSSARHLLELINDVLDLSKIEAGQLEIHPRPFDLPASIRKVSDLVAPLAEKKGLTLECSISPGISGMVSDQRRVEQILINLLNNAVKFTDAGDITITTDFLSNASPRPGTQPCPCVKIGIADTGIGIKPECQTSLFRPFHQLDSGLSRQHEGTGLGLAICRQLTHLLGGDIQVSSVWLKGSCFSVTLPLRLARPS